MPFFIIMYELINNTEKQQYEFHIEGYVAKLEYKMRGDKILLIHTEVPHELGGRGIAAQLVESVFKDIQSQGIKMAPYCPYVKAYLKRHPEWETILA